MALVRLLVFAILVVTVSCSRPAPEAGKSTPAPKVTTHPPPKDLTIKLPSAGQTKIELVPDHLLGKDFMPGGNLASYKTPAGEYRIFLLQAADPQAAAFLLLDWKSALADAKYLAHMGGYYGTDAGKPVYVFSKGPYLAGLLDIPEEKADAEARRLAARL